jgi:hypothetical protein
LLDKSGFRVYNNIISKIKGSGIMAEKLIVKPKLDVVFKLLFVEHPEIAVKPIRRPDRMA